MNVHQVDLLFAAVIVLAAAVIAVPLSSLLGLGSIFGYLVAGAAVGPWGLGIASEVDVIRHFSELGVVFLLFTIGLELHPSRLWAMRRNLFGLGLLQILLSGLLITAYAWVFNLRLGVAVVVGFGLALSSTAIGLQTLTEKGDITSRYGQAAFAILLMQDIAIVPLLALVPLFGNMPSQGGTAFASQGLLIGGGVLSILIAVRFLLQPLLHLLARGGNPEIFAGASVLAVLGAAWLMEQVGVSMALGAFLVGLLLSDSPYRHQIEAEVEPFRGFLLGLFFMAIGMSIDFGFFAREGLMMLGHLTGMLVIKSMVLFGLCLAFRHTLTDAVRVGLLLPQCGEFGFVLFGVAATSGVMSQALFQPLLLLIAITMLATPVLTMLADWLVKRLDDAEELEKRAHPALQLEGHVVIAGFGRIGETIGTMLRGSQVSYVALDMNPDTVTAGRSRGYEVVLGDATRVAVLKAAGVGRARLAVVALEDAAKAEKTVAAIRHFYPSLPIEVRAHDLLHGERLRSLGATGTVPETLEAGLQLGRTVLFRAGVTQDQADALVEYIRQDDYALLRRSRAD